MTATGSLCRIRPSPRQLCSRGFGGVSNSSSAATAASYHGMGLFSIMFILMFLTGNCESCNDNNQDYLQGAIDAAAK